MLWKSELAGRSPTTGIAVLPFENLSNDREDASFADGVQDDLVTKLANIADPQGDQPDQRHAISWRAITHVRSVKRLRVSHVLEGSVREDRRVAAYKRPVDRYSH